MIAQSAREALLLEISDYLGDNDQYTATKILLDDLGYQTTNDITESYSRLSILLGMKPALLKKCRDLVLPGNVSFLKLFPNDVSSVVSQDRKYFSVTYNHTGS